jgi:hypothetical protein
MEDSENVGPLVGIGVIVIVLAVLVALGVVCAVVVVGGNLLQLTGG